MRSLLIRLYPARWRARYRDEFLAILEERPLGPFDVADILLGALDARLWQRGRGAGNAQKGRFSMSLRIGGLAAILGPSIIALVILSGGLAGDLAGDRDQDAPKLGLMVGLAGLLVALTGLSAFQARSNPGLVWAAFAVTAVGTVGIFIAGVTDLAGTGPADWRDGILPVGGLTAALGSALFGIATYRVSALSRRGASCLVAGPVLGVLGAITVSQNVWALGMLLVLVGTVTFLAGWFALGVQAIRLDRAAGAPRPA